MEQTMTMQAFDRFRVQQTGDAGVETVSLDAVPIRVSFDIQAQPPLLGTKTQARFRITNTSANEVRVQDTVTVNGSSIGSIDTVIPSGETIERELSFNVPDATEVVLSARSLTATTTAETALPISISIDDVRPSTPVPGDQVTVTAAVTNRQDMEVNTVLSFQVDGRQINRGLATVPPGETVRERFTHTFSQPGDHSISVNFPVEFWDAIEDDATTTITVRSSPSQPQPEPDPQPEPEPQPDAGSEQPRDFELVGFTDAPDTVTKGEEVTLSVGATCKRLECSGTLALSVDGSQVATKRIDPVLPGRTDITEFPLRFQKTGERTITVATEGQTRSTTITVKQPQPEPEPSPEPQPSPEPEPEPEPQPEPEPEPQPKPEEPVGPTVPSVEEAGGAAVAGAAGLLLLLVFVLGS